MPNRALPPRRVIFGLTGPRLSEAEGKFFASVQPFGFILFARNCTDPQQVRSLVEALKRSVERDDVAILIDQEGGRVQRLRPPHWREAPPAGSFGRRALQDEGAAVEAAYLNARLLAAELSDLGITHDCAPVLDVPQLGADPIIGDRAFANEPRLISLLARATCDGLIDGGVLPIIKHIPGHGRANADSHLRLPVVTASREDLESVDFVPFQELADMPWAMTAHVAYHALDSETPATTSPAIIHRIIRDQIGFDGVLVSDDICMKALAGTPAERAEACLEAGCDVILHCNGDLDEMKEVAPACMPVSGDTAVRLCAAEAKRRAPAPIDVRLACDRLEAIMTEGASAA